MAAKHIQFCLYCGFAVWRSACLQLWLVSRTEVKQGLWFPRESHRKMEKQMWFKSEQRERTEFSPPVESSPLLPKEIKALARKKRKKRREAPWINSSSEKELKERSWKKAEEEEKRRSSKQFFLLKKRAQRSCKREEEENKDKDLLAYCDDRSLRISLPLMICFGSPYSSSYPNPMFKEQRPLSIPLPAFSLRLFFVFSRLTRLQ